MPALTRLITATGLTVLAACTGNRQASTIPSTVALPVLADSAREPGYGVILGVVLDSASATPVEHGSVYVRLTRDSARHDAARQVPIRSGVPVGGFVLTHLAPGRYDVWVRTLGRTAGLMRNVVVRRDAVDTLVLRLNPSPIKLLPIVPNTAEKTQDH